jgi:hypothetical protein
MFASNDVTRVFKFEIKSVTKSTCLDPHSRIQFIEYIETLPVHMRPIKSGGNEPMPSKALLVKGLKSDRVLFSTYFLNIYICFCAGNFFEFG